MEYCIGNLSGALSISPYLILPPKDDTMIEPKKYAQERETENQYSVSQQQEEGNDRLYHFSDHAGVSSEEKRVSIEIPYVTWEKIDSTAKLFILGGFAGIATFGNLSGVIGCSLIGAWAGWTRPR